MLHVVAIQCDGLSDPDNGAVSVTGTGVGDTATYTCDAGYELIGSSTRTCQSNGDWSESSPTCEGKPKNQEYIKKSIQLQATSIHELSVK